MDEDFEEANPVDTDSETDNYSEEESDENIAEIGSSEDDEDDWLATAQVKTEPVDDDRRPESEEDTEENRGRLLRETAKELRLAKMRKEQESTGSKKTFLNKTSEELKAQYLAGVAKANSDGRKRSRSGDENFELSEEDKENQEMEDFFDKSLLGNRASAKKLKKSRSSIRGFRLYDEEGVKLEDMGEVGDYVPGQPLMKKSFITVEKMNEILKESIPKDPSIGRVSEVVHTMVINVKAIKFKNEDPLVSSSQTNKQKERYKAKWGSSDQKLDFGIKFYTKLNNFSKTYDFDLESMIEGEIFKIQHLIRNVLQSFTDRTHPLCVLNTLSKPQRPVSLPADLIFTGVRVAAGQSTLKYFEDNVFCKNRRDLPDLHAKITLPSVVKQHLGNNLDVETLKTLSKLKQRKRYLNIRFFERTDIDSEDSKSFMNSWKRIATLTLKCCGEGMECKTRCGLPVRDTKHLDWTTASNNVCQSCNEVIQTKNTKHDQCGFEIVLIMFANRLNVWYIYVRYENKIYHPDNDPREKFFSDMQTDVIGQT